MPTRPRPSGRHDLHRLVYRDPRSPAVRRRVLERDGRRCSACDRPVEGRAAQVAHVGGCACPGCWPHLGLEPAWLETRCPAHNRRTAHRRGEDRVLDRRLDAWRPPLPEPEPGPGPPTAGVPWFG